MGLRFVTEAPASIEISQIGFNSHSNKISLSVVSINDTDGEALFHRTNMPFVE